MAQVRSLHLNPIKNCGHLKLTSRLILSGWHIKEVACRKLQHCFSFTPPFQKGSPLKGWSYKKMQSCSHNGCVNEMLKWTHVLSDIRKVICSPESLFINDHFVRSQCRIHKWKNYSIQMYIWLSKLDKSYT